MAITFKLITSVTLSSNTTTLTISGIPNTYTDLYLIGRVWETDSSNYRVNDILQMNNDTNSRYGAVSTVYNGSTTLDFLTNTNMTQLSWWNTGTAFITAEGRVWESYLWDYASNRMKPVYYQTSISSGSSSALILGQSGGFYNYVDAISSLKFTAQSTAFASGSRIDLYGILRA